MQNDIEGEIRWKRAQNMILKDKKCQKLGREWEDISVKHCCDQTLQYAKVQTCKE